MLDKIRYSGYRLFWEIISDLALPFIGPQHHARAQLIKYIFGVLMTNGDRVTVQIIAATDEQEKQARLLLRDYESLADDENRIQIVGDSRADVCIRIAENWMTRVETRCSFDRNTYDIGAFPLPPIRGDDEAPDEYHGFELDEIDATPTTLDDLDFEGDNR